MIHKLTLGTLLMASLLQKHSIDNDQKLSLCILTRNSYSPSSFKICHLNFVYLFSQIVGLPKIYREMFLKE